MDLRLNRIKYIFTLIIFKVSFILGQKEKIEFIDFGIIKVSSDLFLGENFWNLSISSNDTTVFLEKKSTINQNHIFFNVNNINSNFDYRNSLLYTIRKNDRVIYEKNNAFIFEPQNSHFLVAVNFENELIKGIIIDSYKVKFVNGSFNIVRSYVEDKYNYWYMFFGDTLLNIHSEKSLKQPLSASKIVVTDLDGDDIPEINFFYISDKKNKIIHFNKEKKLLAYKKNRKVKLPLIISGQNNLIYQGFFTYYLSQSDE